MTDPFAPLSGKPNPTPEPPSGECVMPVPEGAQVPMFTHATFGRPARVWPYTDAAGAVLGYGCRFEVDAIPATATTPAQPAAKHCRYYTLWRKTPDAPLKWEWKHWPRPKPLYGLDRLALRPEAPVVLCEGEKAADAAGTLLPDYVHMCWPGGAMATGTVDWSPLAGRDVLLWADNDEPGHKAMKAATLQLNEAKAGSVRQINREALARAVSLQPGDDASDLVTRDRWTAARMAEFTSDPLAILGEPSPEEAGANHAHLVKAVRLWLRTNHYSADATGAWLQRGRSARKTTTASLATAFAYAYRFTAPIGTDRVSELMSFIAREQAEARLEAIRDRIIGKPATEAGQMEAARFVTALTGDQDELTLVVLIHWIWLVKRSLAELPREYDLMPIAHGEQGSGKSTAIARLCAVLEELVDPINATLLTDDRRAPELESYYIGLWDEMEGAGKADVEALKNSITCVRKQYRPMKTNDSAHAIRCMNFIGTSNKPIAQMVRDTTGARRFFQIECMPRVDWDAVNGIDYDLLWSCVSEKDPAPIKAALSLLAAHQAGLRHQDSVSYWLDDETWSEFRWVRTEGLPEELIPAYSAQDGESAEEVRTRYVHWCKRNGEQPVQGNAFFQRLAEHGFTLARSRRFKQQRRYYRCAGENP